MPKDIPTVAFASHLSCLDGGAQRCLFDIAVALRRDGRIDPVVTVPSDGALAAAMRAESIRCFVLPTPWWVLDPNPSRLPFSRRGFARRCWRALVIARSIARWLRWLRSERPDIVVTNTGVTATPALASAIARVPHVWWLHEFVTRDHGLSYLLGEALSQRSIGWLSRMVVANARAVQGHFSPPIRADKIRLIYQGIVGFEASPNIVDPPTLRVLLLGVLAPAKRADLALEAASILRSEQISVRLRLVGPSSTSYREVLDQLAVDLGIADCVEIGRVTIEPQVELAWANVVLVCSDCEAFGRVTLEALKSGRPVVGTRSGGTTELVSDGVNGFLFTPGNAQELAAALRRLASDPGLLTTMSENACASVGDRFAMESEVDQLVAVLRAVNGREAPDLWTRPG